MAETKYTYTISVDTQNGKVDGSKLQAEIVADATIITAPSYISTYSDVLEVYMKDALDAGEEAALDSVVGAHDGVPTVETPSFEMVGPKEHDGRINVVNSPMSSGWWTWFCGAGDDLNPTPPSSGRGDGQKLNFTFTGPDTQEKVLDISEPIEIHDGQLFYEPAASWTIEDRFNFQIRMPANSPAPNGTTTGNCNLVDSGQGYNVIVPAAGDGTHDIDLDSAVPVTADGEGYWDVDRETGGVSIGTPGEADWHLIDAQVDVFFMKNMPMGHPMGVLDIDAYKSEWIHKNWKLVVNITKASSGSGTAAGWLLSYRKNVN